MGHYSATKNKTMSFIGKRMLSEISQTQKISITYVLLYMDHRKKIIEMPPKIEERLSGKKKRMRRE